MLICCAENLFDIYIYIILCGWKNSPPSLRILKTLETSTCLRPALDYQPVTNTNLTPSTRKCKKPETTTKKTRKKPPKVSAAPTAPPRSSAGPAPCRPRGTTGASQPAGLHGPAPQNAGPVQATDGSVVTASKSRTKKTQLLTRKH